MRPSVIILTGLVLTGCAVNNKPNDQLDIEYGSVKIYSTQNLSEAQAKATSLCGSHAYLMSSEYESNLKNINESKVNGLIFNYIPFQCDVFVAAKSGNLEAKKIAESKLDEMHKILYEKKKMQYDIHKKYAENNGGDSYSVVNPDGSVEAHSFDDAGSACHASSSKFGSEVSCE